MKKQQQQLKSPATTLPTVVWVLVCKYIADYPSRSAMRLVCLAWQQCTMIAHPCLSVTLRSSGSDFGGAFEQLLQKGGLAKLQFFTVRSKYPTLQTEQRKDRKEDNEVNEDFTCHHCYENKLNNDQLWRSPNSTVVVGELLPISSIRILSSSCPALCAVTLQTPLSTEKMVCLAETMGSNLRSLRLQWEETECLSLTPPLLVALWKNCGNLERLELPNSYSEFGGEPMNLSKLKGAGLRGLRALAAPTDAGVVSELLSLVYSLQEVHMRTCSSECFILLSNMQELRVVDLDRLVCHSIDGLDMVRLTRNNPHLQVLSINLAVPLVTKEAIKSLANNCRDLRVLNISKCVLRSDEAIETLCTACTKLEELHLGYNHLSDRSTAALGNLKCLVGLNLSYNYNMTSYSADLLSAQDKFTALRYLNVLNCPFADCLPPRQGVCRRDGFTPFSSWWEKEMAVESEVQTKTAQLVQPYEFFLCRKKPLFCRR